MIYSRISLITPAGISLALCNTFPKVIEVEDAIEDSKNAEELATRLKFFTTNYAKKITVDRETEDYIRLKVICNMCDNLEYLKIYKK